MKNILSFQFTPTFFAAKCNDHMILLDALHDEYISLSTSSSEALIFALANQFVFKNNTYIATSLPSANKKKLEQLDKMIKHFLQKNIIVTCASHRDKKSFVTPISSLGLHKRDWMPPHLHEKPKIRFWELLKALMAVRKAHHTLQTKKLTGIMELLHSLESQKKNGCQNANSDDIDRLAYTLDNACLLYPQKTLCLPWATALAALLLKRGIRCSLVIGVQACPFYAHAWVEVEGKIINDNPQLRECLAPILTLSFNMTTPQTITPPIINA